MSARDDFKGSFKTWKAGLTAIVAIITLITAALGQFTGLLSFIPAPYLTLAKVALLYIGVVILVWLFTHSILTKKEQIKGFTHAKEEPWIYSATKRRWARVFRIVSILLLLPFFIWGYNIREGLIRNCAMKSHYTGILITKFSDNPDDQFSFHLFNYLSNNLYDSLIMIDPIDQYISLSARADFKDSLSPLLQCYKNGMIVFGSRNINEKSFICSFYTRDIQANGQKVTDLLEPPSIELNISSQTDIIGKLILAQLNYKLGNNQQSLAYVDTLLKSSIVQGDSALKSYCFLYKGLNQLKANQYQESIQSFELASNSNKGLPAIQHAISYMRTLKFYEADFHNPAPEQPQNTEGVIANANILIKKGFVINDSVGYTFTDADGRAIKDTVFALSDDKYVILPSKSKYYTVYLGTDKVIQLGAGKKDSLQAQRSLDSIGTKNDPKKSVIKTNANFRNWKKMNKNQERQ